MADLIVTTEPQVRRQTGDTWDIGVLLLDDDGRPVAATVTATTTDPDGNPATVTLTSETTGYYDGVVTPTFPGRWVATFTATGYGVASLVANVVDVVDEQGMPDVAGFMAYAGTTSLDATTVQAALDAERSAQARGCRIGAIYPPDLVAALYRRTARHLALKGIPLAVKFGDADSGPTYVPGRDPEIRRLEAPYRKTLVG